MEVIAARTPKHLCTLIVLSVYLIIANNQPIPPGVITHPATQTIVEGGNATFRCIIYNNTETTLVAIGWEKLDSDGLVYYILTGPRYYYSMDTQILTITNVSFEDAGDYYCVVYRRNPDSEERGNHSTLDVIEQAALDLPDNIEQVIGQNVTINAVIRGGSHITLQKKNKASGKFESLYLGKYSVLNGTITIYFLSAEDKGEYRACVSSSVIPSNTACRDFVITVTGFPFISLVPLTTIRNGSSCTITCNVIGPSTEDLQMTWQRVDGLPLTGQVTQPSKTQLQLYIQRVTDTVHYQCIANNSLGINAVVTKVDVTSCVPSSPSITSLSCSNGTIYIAWSSAKTDSNLLTAYVVEINKATYRISPSTNSLRIHVCEDSVVSVTAENSCGRSVPAMSTFYTTTLDTSSSSITTTGPLVGKDQSIIIGMAVIFVLTTSILTIIILISWRKINLLKKQLFE